MEPVGIAAGLVVAEQVVSTTVEAGVVGGYALAKKTLPMKGSFTCIGTVADGSSPDSLARSSHTVSAIEGDLYIFGGLVSADTLAGNEMHILKLSTAAGKGAQYKCVPALGNDSDEVPSPRAGHSACTFEGKIYVFGGYSESKTPIDEQSRIWVFDPTSLCWSFLDTSSDKCPARYDHVILNHGRKLFIHGGYTADSDGDKPTADTWCLDLDSRAWIALPALTTDFIAIAPPNFAVADDTLYLISSATDLSSQIHHLNLSSNTPTWETWSFAHNPLTPGPRPRKGAGLLPIKTGQGRTYLLFMLGAKDNSAHANAENSTSKDEEETEFWSGLWVLQLPSTEKSLARVKDLTRDKLGLETHEIEWAEVVIEVRTETDAHSGKSHPGPRGYFGAAALDGKQVALWGGINAKGEIEPDGWIIDLKT